MKRLKTIHGAALLAALVVLIVGTLNLGWWQMRRGKSPVKALVSLTEIGAPEPVASAPAAYDVAAWTTFKEKLRGCEAEAPLTTVAFVGDMMLSRSVGTDMKASGDYDASFAAMAPWLRSADLAFGNLETAITPGREIKINEMTFRADAPVAAAMARAGFDVVSLANNHTPNFGAVGMTDTFKTLKEAGVRYVGAGRDDFEAYQPAYLQANGLTFAFIAENDTDVVPKSYGAATQHPGTALLDLDKLKAAVAEAHGVADVVIFSLHSGKEYSASASDRQKMFAHAAIDAGADLVIGHHAHVVQEMEVYNGKPILYGLGNFLFDQTFSQDTQNGLAVRAEWRGRTLERLELEPLRLGASFVPDFANPDLSKKILARLAYGVTTERAWRWNDLERRLKPEDRAAVVLEGASVCVKREGTWPLGAATLQLANGQLSLMAEATLAWTSPSDLWIEDLAVATTAGRAMATVAYWQPSADQPQMHLGALTWHNSQPVWEPDVRPLRAPACSLALAELDGGDQPETIAILGDYAESPACQGREAAVFRGVSGAYDEIVSLAQGPFNGLTVGRRQGYVIIQPHLTP